MRFFFCAFFYIPFFLSAQNWPAESAVWEYCVTFLPAGQIGTETYAYTEDVLINDTTYSIVRPIAYDGDPFSLEEAEFFNRVTLIRQSGDTIYRRVSDREYIFFINGLEIGDSFTTFRSAASETNLIACLEDLVLEVIDVETIEYAGLEYTSVRLRDENFEDVYGFELDDPLEYSFVEGIGLLTNFPYFWDVGTADAPFPPEETCSPSSDGVGNLDLFEYSDSMTSFEIGFCEPSGLDERIIGRLEIYPNPAQNYIEIKHPNLTSDLTYSIYDSRGILIAQSVLNSHRIDLMNLNSGLYSIIVEDSSSGIFTGRVIVL